MKKNSAGKELNSAKLPKSILELKDRDLRWVSVTQVDDSVMSWLKNQFNFHDTDLTDTLPPLQRPKIIDRGDYIFMILLFPLYDRETKELRPSEIDFFISKDFLVTINANELVPLKNLFEACSLNNKEKNICMSADTPTLLYEVLNKLLEDASKMLVHVSNDIDAIEEKIFTEFQKGMISKLLRIKTNIVNFRRSMQSHKLIIGRLVELSPKYFSAEKLKNYFQNLLEMTQEIWDLLENYKDTVDALHETNVSLIDFRINEIMKTLTIFAVMTFPLTLFVTLFGTNLQGMPFASLPYGFWIIVGIVFAGALSMFWFFEKKKWL